ncbi:MAG: 2-dehydropantoate 2-reductase [Candidatus Eremiobacteraeota bacterium]|jgi:2-dehydropantoate 2-reductase|nr:2-dehydropantoate 2-reductase [Candidatus Eremiobacteraeota bacterium]
MAALASVSRSSHRDAVASYAVVGAGAIGAYVGASLARAGSDVTLIARGEHLAAMRRSGVRVLCEAGDFQVDVRATDDPSSAGTFDCIIVALKGHQLAQMLPAIASMCHARTRIVPMQNGIPWWYFQRHGGPHDGLVLNSVDPDGKLAAAFDPDRLIGCVIYSSTEIEAPGVIRHIEGTRYALGRPDGEIDPCLEEISAAMIAGGLKAPIERDLRAQIWLKILGNAALNPISALTRSTIAGMLRDPSIEALVREIMTECSTIANALGVEIPVSIDKRIDGARRVGEHKTSMLQDVERGRPLEFDCISGAVVELGAVLGVPTPATSHVHALTRLLDTSLCTA